MFRQHHYTQQHSQNSKTIETPQQRIERIKRTKNIRKQKIQRKRNQQIGVTGVCEQEQSMRTKDKLSREQKSQLQKQKNRLAAQQSRDKQKQYLHDLQLKIEELQTQISKQLCIKCGNSLTLENSTNQYSPEERSSFSEDQILDEEKIQNYPFSVEVQQFYREQSDDSVNSIGKFLFICMISIALISFSASIDGNLAEASSGSNRFLQAIAPVDTKYWQNSQKILPSTNDQFSTSLCQLTTLQSTLLATQKLGKSENRCKNEYIQNYFLGEQELQLPRNYQYSQYDNNRLLNCAKPQLIMKKDINQPDDQDNKSFFSGLFTVVLDNPEIMEVISNKGVMYLDNVVSLRGLYQIQVKFMNIKKVMSQSCLN